MAKNKHLTLSKRIHIEKMLNKTASAPHVLATVSITTRMSARFWLPLPMSATDVQPKRACILEKHLYSSSSAQKEYALVRSESMRSISLSEEEAASLDRIVSPLILLTVHFAQPQFMLAFLRDSNNSESVANIFDNLYLILSPQWFMKLFPKGTSFDLHTQEDIGLMMSHINSYRRKNLGDLSPYDVFQTFYSGDILKKLNVLPIPPPEEVILLPALLK